MKTIIKIRILVAAFLFVALLVGCSGGSGGMDDSGDVDGSGSVDSSEAADGALDPGSGADNSGQPGDRNTLTGATDIILQRIVDEANAALDEADALPTTFMETITPENAPVMLGLIPDDFVEFAEEAAVIQSLPDPHAFQVALVNCKDIPSAQIVNEQIKNSFDSGKWISVFPEQSLTILSGSYVLLAVGNTAQTAAFAEAFKTFAGANVSAPEIFYEGETGSL